MQAILAPLLVAICAVYLALQLWRSIKQGGRCAHCAYGHHMKQQRGRCENLLQIIGATRESHAANYSGSGGSSSEAGSGSGTRTRPGMP